MLNCKQGDLAIVVGSSRPGSPNIGKVVRCLEFVSEGRAIVWPNGRATQSGSNIWIVDQRLVHFNQRTGEAVGTLNEVPDKFLRPLRDQKGEDETFQWAGKPKKQRSKA